MTTIWEAEEQVVQRLCGQRVRPGSQKGKETGVSGPNCTGGRADELIFWATVRTLDFPLRGRRSPRRFSTSADSYSKSIIQCAGVQTDEAAAGRPMRSPLQQSRGGKMAGLGPRRECGGGEKGLGSEYILDVEPTQFPVGRIK